MRLFRIIISKVTVTAERKISLRKTETVGMMGEMEVGGRDFPQRHAPRAARVLRAPGLLYCTVLPLYVVLYRS